MARKNDSGLSLLTIIFVIGFVMFAGVWGIGLVLLCISGWILKEVE